MGQLWPTVFDLLSVACTGKPCTTSTGVDTGGEGGNGNNGGDGGGGVAWEGQCVALAFRSLRVRKK